MLRVVIFPISLGHEASFPQLTYFQTRFRSKVLGVRISISEFLGNTVQPITVLICHNKTNHKEKVKGTKENGVHLSLRGENNGVGCDLWGYYGDFSHTADNLVSLLCSFDHLYLLQGARICPVSFAWLHVPLIYSPTDGAGTCGTLAVLTLIWASQILSGVGRNSGPLELIV